MTAAEVLQALSIRGVMLKAEGDRLLYQPKQLVDAHLRLEMVSNKADLLAFVSHFGEWCQKNNGGPLIISALVN